MPTRDQWAENHHNWKGGRRLNEAGYVMVLSRGRHRSYIFEHRLVVERAIGRQLKRSEVVHHVNDDKQANQSSNLVALENLSEHMALHARRAVLRAGGNPWKDAICADCGVRPKTEFAVNSRGTGVACRCRPCRRAHDNKRYAEVGSDKRKAARVAARVA